MNALAIFHTAVATIKGYGQRGVHRLRLLWSKLDRKPK